MPEYTADVKVAGGPRGGALGEGAGATGLEPAASGVTGRRSNQLNYAPAWDIGSLADRLSAVSLQAAFPP